MKNFKDRLIKENDELKEKINKLDDFIISDSINNIDSIQRKLLYIQLDIMHSLNQCLICRIELLKNN